MIEEFCGCKSTHIEGYYSLAKSVEGPKINKCSLLGSLDIQVRYISHNISLIETMNHER